MRGRGRSAGRACALALLVVSAVLVVSLRSLPLYSPTRLALSPRQGLRADRPILSQRGLFSRGLKAKNMRRLHACGRDRSMEFAPGQILKSMAGSVLLSLLMSTPSYAKVVKSAPILAPKDTGVEITIDEAHGQAEILDRISKWDSNKNGRISREEFESGMRDYVPHELSPGQLDQAWARIQGVELERRATDPSYSGNKLTDEQKQLPQPGQPIDLPTSRVKSHIPKQEGGFWQYPSPQQAYNAMVRKGKDPDIYRAKDFVSTHNEMNERGWNQVLHYESITHPECPQEKIKLSKFNGDYDGRVKGSFDRHYWTVNRCGTEEQTYVLDYFDLKKQDEITMPYSNEDIEIQVKPDPASAAAKKDTEKYKAKVGKEYSSTSDFDTMLF